MRRWSDNEKKFGPFTYARDNKDYRPLAMVLGSGDDEYPGASFRMRGFGHTFIVQLPAIIKPWKRWVDLSNRDWAETPNAGYWDIHSREYGFSVADGFLQVFLGPQTLDSDTTKSWIKFLPWKQWRHVRRSFYGLNGEHVASLPDTPNSHFLDPGRYDRERAIADATPTASFEFDDFDGERLSARTRIEEREWKRGEGWFKWLAWIVAPKIVRSLDIEFSGETCRRKGTRKGGTIGHSIDMLPGELHESAFRRYCAEHRMTFASPATPPKARAV